MFPRSDVDIPAPDEIAMAPDGPVGDASGGKWVSTIGAVQVSLAIHLSHHDVDRTDDGGHIRQQAVSGHLIEDREVAERSGSCLASVGHGSALALKEEA